MHKSRPNDSITSISKDICNMTAGYTYSLFPTNLLSTTLFERKGTHIFKVASSGTSLQLQNTTNLFIVNAKNSPQLGTTSHEHGSVWCGFESKPHRNHIYSVSKIKNQNQIIHKWCGSVF